MEAVWRIPAAVHFHGRIRPTPKRLRPSAALASRRRNLAPSLRQPRARRRQRRCPVPARRLNNPAAPTAAPTPSRVLFREREASTQDARPHQRWILVAAAVGSGIVFLDGSVVTVALPRIGQELPATFLGVLEGQSYVYNGYLLALRALLIIAGALNDYHGRRKMFAVGLAGFGATSALCGLAPTMEALVAARVLQGAAGALLVPGALALITTNFEGEDQGRAFGTWAATSGATSILGPLLGGVLVDTISWRMVFWINLPLVFLGLWATLRHVPESRDQNATGRFDWLGSIVIALAVGGLAFGATYGQQRDWRDPLAFWALGVGILGVLLFPVLMLKRADPLVPPHLFSSRNFSVTNLATFVIYGSLYVSLYYIPLFLQGTLGYTALGAGLSFMIGPVLLVCLSTKFGGWAARYGPRRFMAVGPALMAAGFLWVARVPASSEAWAVRPGSLGSFMPPLSYFIDVLPATLLLGLGLAVMVAPLTTALMQSVPEQNAGLASAINNAISRVGSPLMGALIFVFVTGRFYSALAAMVPGLDAADPGLRDLVSPLNQPGPSAGSALVEAARIASADVFHVAMWFGAALMLVGAIVAGVGIRDRTSPTDAGAGSRGSPG